VSLPGQVAVLAAAFAGATLLAELLGADNLGIAMSFGQIAFVLVLIWLIVRPRAGR
jgi:hypothetical protein